MRYFILSIFFLICCSACNKADEYFTKVNPNQATPIDTGAQLNLVAGSRNILYPYGGVNRKFIIQLPAGFDAQKTYPVVFAFHGSTLRYTSWQDLLGSMINQREYIGVYPAAVDSFFNVGQAAMAGVDDLGYLQRIISWMNTKTNVKTDPARYYALGVGTGGAFVHYLALHTSYFAAIAPVSASLSASMMNGATVSRQVPVIQIHGDPDEGILYGGGAGPLGLTWESAQNSIKLWAARNACGNAPKVGTEAGLTRYAYPEFVGAAESTLYVASGVTSVYSEVNINDLNNLIWNFFARH